MFSRPAWAVYTGQAYKGETLVCARNSPRPSTGSREYWPRVCPLGWCGDFRHGTGGEPYLYKMSPEQRKKQLKGLRNSQAKRKKAIDTMNET